jgi:hypothetical protein
MVVLYGLLIGLAVGWLRAGSISRVPDLRFTWSSLAVCGLAIQVLLFLPPVAESIGILGRPVYLSSTVAVFAFVLLNLRVPGMPLLAVGALSNLVAILANGGAMPVDPAAAAALGHVSGAAFNNTFATDHAVLRPLTDIFALPRWLPAANVVSIGDLLISIGMAWTVVAAFGRGAPLGGDPGQRPGFPPSGPAVRGGTSP